MGKSKNKIFYQLNIIGRKHSWLIIILSAVLVYSNTFSSPFTYDDKDQIINNLSIRDILNLKAMAVHDPTHLITNISLALNYHFHKLRVWGYHLVNLIIHAGSGLLVWQLVRLTFITPVMKKVKMAGKAKWIALFSGLLFVLHPVQTEAVTYIVQRGTSLAAFFYLASLIFYIKAGLLRGGNMSVSAGALSVRKNYVLSLLTACLGMYSKQTVITLPFMILLYEYSFMRGSGETIAATRLPWKKIFPFFILMFIVPINTALSKSSALWQIDSLTREVAMSRSIYLLTQFRVLTTYLRLFLAPFNQNLDYDYPLAQSLLEPSVFASLLLLFFILATGVVLWSKHRMLSFSIFWFFITLSVESSFIPIRDVIFEHRLYLPMVSYSIFLPYILFSICRNSNRVKMFLIILVCGCGCLTYTRNEVWKDELTLWTDAAKKSPDKVRPEYACGNIYRQRGDSEKAIACYTRSLKKNPLFYDAYNNRGIVYGDTFQYDKALADFDRAVEICSSKPDAYANRADVYNFLGREEQALTDFNKALEVDPLYFLARYNRGNLYARRGEYERAIADYTRVIKINPSYYKAYNNRGAVYKDSGQCDKALADFNRVIEIDPDQPAAYANRAGIYSSLGRDELALSDFNRAIEVDPAYFLTYYNRANLYQQRGEYEKAIADYTQTLNLNPNHAGACNNRAVLLFMKKDYEKAWLDVKKMQSLNYRIDPEFLEGLRDKIVEKKHNIN